MKTTPTRQHRVVRGESLSRIAARYGVTVSAIAAANGIRDVNKISAGQLLNIPTPGAGLYSSSDIPFVNAGTADSGSSKVLTSTGQSGSWIDSLPGLITAGTTAAIEIGNARANQRIAILNGQPVPVSNTTAEEVAGRQSQSEGTSESVKWLLIAGGAALLGAFVLNPD